MYGIYGGFTTIYHLVVRFPLLVTCIAVGGATYKALTCPPPPASDVAASVIVAPPPVVVLPLPVVETRDTSVYFDTDKSVIKPEFRKTLQQEADFLTAHPNVTVRIEGHTDARAPDDYNLLLGAKRAAAVKATLLSMGVAEKQIDGTISHGKRLNRLLCPKESCYKENRRVDVFSKHQ